MLIDINAEAFKEHFPNNLNPFIKEPFVALNAFKVERVVRLIEDNNKASIGLVAGVKDLVFKSPFSAPFGGFHFTHEELFISEIDNFLEELKSYVFSIGCKKIELKLPPDIYHPSFNAKMINALLRSDFKLAIPEISSLVYLEQFSDGFYNYSTRKKYNQALRNELSFNSILKREEKIAAYEIIVENRSRNGRPIYMKFDDLEAIGKLWPIDFFRVDDKEGQMVASAILYQNHPQIVYAVFWGDSEYGRTLGSMDFLIFNLWKYYKEIGYKYIDLSISTESGIPNEGLLRFKEIHQSVSTLRLSFTWNLR